MLTHGALLELLKGGLVPGEILGSGDKRDRFVGLSIGLCELLFSPAFDDLVHFLLVERVHFVADQPQNAFAHLVELFVSKKSRGLHRVASAY
jgi:hypothetical protein